MLLVKKKQVCLIISNIFFTSNRKFLSLSTGNTNWIHLNILNIGGQIKTTEFATGQWRAIKCDLMPSVVIKVHVLTKVEVINQMYHKLVRSTYQITLMAEKKKLIFNVCCLEMKKRWLQHLAEAAKVFKTIKIVYLNLHLFMFYEYCVLWGDFMNGNDEWVLSICFHSYVH